MEPQPEETQQATIDRLCAQVAELTHRITSAENEIRDLKRRR